MPFFVETMTPEWARVGVGLIITLAVDALEEVRVWFVLFGFKPRGIDLKISLAAPGKVAVVFSFMWTVALQTSYTLKMANKDGVTPLPAIFALRDTGIHISPSDSNNKAIDVEVVIDEFLCHKTIL